MAGLATRVGPVDLGGDSDDPGLRWAKPLAVAFVVLGIPYVNLRKNVADWTRVRAVPEVIYGIPAWIWFELAVVVVAVGLAVLIVRHTRRPLAVVPSSLLGQGQGLYLVLLAIMVIGNFERAVVSFADQRLVTEGVIHCVAVLCAVVLLVSDESSVVAEQPEPGGSQKPIGWRRLLTVGVTAALITILTDWAIVRAIYGDRFAGHAGKHIRFGPNATTHRSR
jgi:hypothetical protein